LAWALEKHCPENENPARGIENFKDAKQAWLEWGNRQHFSALMRCLEIEQFLENLGPDDYDQDDVSPQDDHNCIAYALGEKDKPWWPSIRLKDDFEWPSDLPRQDDDQENFGELHFSFPKRGYKICKNGRLKKGIEKGCYFCHFWTAKTRCSAIRIRYLGKQMRRYEDINISPYHRWREKIMEGGCFSSSSQRRQTILERQNSGLAEQSF